jgi:hypothetical protein
MKDVITFYIIFVWKYDVNFLTVSYSIFVSLVNKLFKVFYETVRIFILDVDINRTIHFCLFFLEFFYSLQPLCHFNNSLLFSAFFFRIKYTNRKKFVWENHVFVNFVWENKLPSNGPVGTYIILWACVY